MPFRPLLPAPGSNAPAVPSAPQHDQVVPWASWRGAASPVRVSLLVDRNRSGLTISPDWLRAHEAMLAPAQEPAMALALTALAGRLPVRDVRSAADGGEFTVDAPGNGAAHWVRYGVGAAARQITRITISAQGGGTIAELGARPAPAGAPAARGSSAGRLTARLKRYSQDDATPRQPGRAKAERAAAQPRKKRRSAAEAAEPASAASSEQPSSAVARFARTPQTVFALAGCKRRLMERESNDALRRVFKAALGAPDYRLFVDAFGGTGFLTLCVAAQGALKPGSILNEFDKYRYITHKQVRQDPAAVKAALRACGRDLALCYYKALNGLPARMSPAELADAIAVQAHGAGAAALDGAARQQLLEAAVQDWIASVEVDQARNKVLSEALKDYLLTRLSEDFDCAANQPRDTPRNAALYIMAQSNQVIRGAPVNIVRTERAKHPSMMSIGSKAALSNGLVENSEEIYLRGGVSRLAIDHRIAALVKKIDQVAPLLQNAEIRNEDGWQLLQNQAAGAFAAIDPAYWEPAGKKRAVTYRVGALPEMREDGFLGIVGRSLLPVWDKGVRMAMTNRYSPYVAQSLANMGWQVYGPIQVTVALHINNDPQRNKPMSELIAANFELDKQASLRHPVKLPDPERLLGEPHALEGELTGRDAEGESDDGLTDRDAEWEPDDSGAERAQE